MVAYATGTVTATNGSKVIDGAGTSFLPPNVYPGDFLVIVGDGKVNEIASIESATRINLVRPFVGGGGGGLAYFVIPSQTHEGDLALRASTLLNVFSAVVEGIGQGLFPNGTVATPAGRFRDDPDTGFYRPGENQIALVTGGVARLTANADGSVGIGNRLNLSSAQGTACVVSFGQAATAAWEMRNVPGLNAMSLVDAQFNVSRQYWDGVGRVGFGTTAPISKGHFADVNATQITVESTSGSGDTGLSFKTPSRTFNLGQNIGGVGAGTFSLYDVTRGAAAWTVDTGGNFIVGATTAAYGATHTFNKAAPNGNGIMVAQSSTTGKIACVILATDVEGWNATPAAMWLGKYSPNGRSINAGGTVNVAGGDACEVFWKALGCGTILKGGIAGIDADGKLTTSWADAVSGFGFKTTNPHLVGRDTFHRKAGPEPRAPVYEQPIYDGPAQPVAPAGSPPALPLLDERPERPVQEDGEEQIDFIVRMARWVVADAAWVAAMNRRPAEVEAYAVASAANDAAVAQYAIDLPAWQRADADYRAKVAAAESAHEVATAEFEAEHAAWTVRLTAAAAEIDRIATNGQVPVDFDGPFEVGQILVPIEATDGGIGMKAVAVDDATEAEMRRSLGTILKRLAADDPDTTETEEIWGRPALGKPWVFVSGLAPGRAR